MKRILVFLLALVTLVSGLFVFTSCKQKKWTKFYTVSHFNGGATIERVDGEYIAKVYIRPDAGYDVDDFSEVKIKYRICDKNGTSRTTPKTVKAQIPENARGNPELQYFYFVLTDKNINREKDRISVVHGKGVLKTDETMTDDDGVPSIFLTIIIGIVMTAVAFGATCLGISVWDEEGMFVLGSANAVPIFFNIGVYSWWGTARGIIISIFCVITLALTIMVWKANE